VLGGFGRSAKAWKSEIFDLSRRGTTAAAASLAIGGRTSVPPVPVPFFM